MKLLRQKYRDRFKLWSDEQIEKDYAMREGIALALEHDSMEYTVEHLVWTKICAGVAEAKKAVKDWQDQLHPAHVPVEERVVLVPLLPLGRLRQHVAAVSEKELADLKTRYNYGDPEGKEALERYTLKERGEAAAGLDLLEAAGKLAMLTHVGGLGDSATCFGLALAYYTGPREAGHSIWLGFNEELRSIMDEALLNGYPIANVEVQKLLVKIATALALMNSKGNGSAGHSDMRR